MEEFIRVVVDHCRHNKREDGAHTQEGKKCLLFIQMPKLSNDAIQCSC